MKSIKWQNTKNKKHRHFALLKCLTLNATYCVTRCKEHGEIFKTTFYFINIYLFLKQKYFGLMKISYIFAAFYFFQFDNAK